MKNLTLEEISSVYGEGGGGGCFVAGTRISTPNGDMAIENISVGDEVWCYVEEHTIGIQKGVVTKTHIHPKEENNSGIYTFYVNGQVALVVTGNHYIQSETGVFCYAANFEVGDAFLDVEGEKCIIDYIMVRPFEECETTYNFEVSPHKTYIANGLRVHNGGGGGDKGSSTPRVAQEAPHTLSSSSTVLLVEVISEGQIVGLVNGAQSISLDGTVVENSDGSMNYEGFYYDQRVGLPTQSYMPGFPGDESVINVSVPVTASTPVVRTTSKADVDGIRVNIVLGGGLYQQNKTNGDMTGHTVSLAIDTRLVGGAWSQVLTPTISGMGVSTYDESYRVNRPNPGGTGDWQVRVRRLSADDPDSSFRSTTGWGYLVEVQDKILEYPNTAYIGLKVDAKSTGGAIPRRAYRCKGIIMNVPTNYDPVARTYSGVWNGTFKTAWTDNPAWIVYDLLINDRYGLGSFIEPAMIDKYSFYDAARYNDEWVSDGNGGYEPRFTFNAYINTRQEAWKLVQAVASNCRAVIYYGAGLIKMIQDRPTPISLVVNGSDVIEGMFNYTSTGLQMRHPVCQVTYSDKADHFNPVTISVEDSAEIARYGYNVREIVAYGATTAGQARRMGLWSLYTELNTTESVKFACGLNLATRIQPGAVIKVVDEELMGVPFGGRVISGTATSITVDRAVQLIAGQTYTVEWLAADGVTIVSRHITNIPGTYTTLFFTAAAEIPIAEHSWVITSNDLTGKLYRIYSVVESAPTTFEVTAFEYVMDKYTQIDQAVNPDTWTPIEKVLNYCPPARDITWSRETETDSYGRRIINLRAMWQQDDSQYIATYMVTWRRDRRDMSSMMVTSNREFVIPNVVAGAYEIYVYAVNVSNVKSKVTLGAYYNDISGGISGLLPPLNLRVVGGSTTWGGKDLNVTWDQNPANNNTGDDVFKGYVVEVRHGVTNDVLRTINLLTAGFTYYFDDNVADTGNTPTRSVKIVVFNKDSYNRTSVPANATLTNPVPLAPSFDLTGGYQYFTADMTPPANTDDVVGYFVAVVPTINTIPALANIVYDGPNNRVDIGFYDPEVIVRVGCYDMFSKNLADVYWSQAKTALITQAQEVVDSTEGYKFFSLEFKPNDPVANKISWTQSIVVKTNTGEQKTLPAGDWLWSNTALYLYYDWNTNIIAGTDTITSAVGVGKALIATYYGGKKINQSNGDAYIDGAKIIAQTVGASQLVTATAVITESAQIASAIIGGVQIADGAVTADKIFANTITGDKLVTNSAIITNNAQIGSAVIGGVNIANGTVTATNIAANTITGNKIAADTITASNLIKTANLITDNAQVGAAVIGGINIADGTITGVKLFQSDVIIANTAQIGNGIITSAKIGDAQIVTAKIGALAVDTLRIQDEAVTATAVYNKTTPYTVPNYFNYPGNNFYTTPTFLVDSDKCMLSVNMNVSWNDGIGVWANVNNGVQTSDAIVGIQVIDASDGSIDYSLQQTIGFSYIEGYWVVAKNGTDQFLLKSNSQRWQNSFDKTFTFTATPGKSYYIKVWAAKSANAWTVPGLVTVSMSSTLTVDEVTITRMVVKK